MTKLIIVIVSGLVFCLAQGSENSKQLEKMQHQAISSLTPLIEAVLEKNIPKITELIEQSKQVKVGLFSKDNLRINAQDKTGQTALMWAIVQELPLDIIKLLLEVKNIDLTIKDKQGLTALYYAVMGGNDEVGQALLKADMTKQDGICPLVNQRDSKLKLTPLARAAMGDKSLIVKLLLQAGANPTAIVTRDDKDVPVSNLYKTDDKEIAELIEAKAEDCWQRGLEVIDVLRNRQLDKAKKLIELGIDVNSATKNGNTPLHWATKWNYKEVAELLVKSKADINAKNDNRNTSLHEAVYHKNKNLIKLFIHHKADVNAQDKDGSTPLHWAIGYDHKDKDLVLLLIANNANINVNENGNGYDDGFDKGTPLHKAVRYGYKDIAELLIKNKADINAKNIHGKTPLHLVYKRKDIMKLLIANKADVNAKDDSGRTCLHNAAYDGQKTIVNILIKAGAAVNTIDQFGGTPLNRAVFNNHRDLIKILKKAGAKQFVSK